MEIYKVFNIPKSCEVKNTIFKKLFYEQANLSSADKKLFANVVNKITWLYCLKPDTINIQVYKDEIREYGEVEFIEVDLNEDRRVNRIAEIIMRTIPYPMVLVFRLREKFKFFVAHQRTSLNDPSKNTIEEPVSTQWVDGDSKLLENLDIRKMRFSNFFDLYCDIVDAISIYKVSDIIEDNASITGEEARELSAQIEEIEKEITSLRANLKKESQFNRKVELNIKIKKMVQKKNKLVGGDRA